MNLMINENILLKFLYGASLTPNNVKQPFSGSSNKSRKEINVIVKLQDSSINSSNNI